MNSYSENAEAQFSLSKYVAIEGTIKRETGAAILLEIDDYIKGHIEIWFPMSQISRIDRANIGAERHLDTIHVARWLADKRGLV